MSYPGVVREHLVSLGDRLLWGMQTYGVSTELFGATAYVGFNEALDPKVNYWYCDGVADDVQIQAAITYVGGLGGGKIVLSVGDYDITNAITVASDNIRLEGMNRYAITVLTLANGSNCNMFTVTGDHFAASWLHLEGNKTQNPTGGYGFYLAGGYPVLENIYVMRTKNSGIWHSYGDAHFMNVYVEYCGNVGWYLQDSQNMTLINCTSWANEGIGIRLLYPQRLTLMNCRIMNNEGHGIQAEYSAAQPTNRRLRIIGGWIVGNDSAGIYFRGIKDSLILGVRVWNNSQGTTNTSSSIAFDDISGEYNENNIIEGCHIYGSGTEPEPKYGIMLGGTSTKNLIVNNNINENDTDGIFLAGDCSDNKINDNIITGNARYGVNISAATCLRTIVKDNYLIGNTTGCINDLGTDTKTPEIFSVVIDPDTTLGTHLAVDLPDGADTTVRFQIPVPLEFQELVTAQVIVAQTATVASPDMQWSTDVDFGKLCADEDYNTHNDAETDQTTAITQNDLECIDVSASLTGLAAGDLVGFEFIRRATQAGDTINAAAYFLGFRLRYV